MLDSLLFKIVSIPDKESAVLAVPEMYADSIIALNHSSLFVGHQGIIKLQTRINLNYRTLLRWSMDLKVMPRSGQGHKFILCIIDEVMNYLITVPIYQAKAEEIGEVLIEHIVTKYFVPDCIIMGQDSTFMSSLINYLFNKFDITIKTVTPYNH